MSPIPPKLREEMALDPFYKKCIITGKTEEIEWHHALIYAGRQLQAKFAIVPVTKYVHDRIIAYQEKILWVVLNRATPEELKKYSKAIDYTYRLKQLNAKYGIWKQT